MRILIIFLIFLSFNLFGQVDMDSYEIYTTIIKEEFKLRNDSINNFVLIHNRTVSQKISETISRASEFIEDGEPIYCNYTDNINELLEQKPEIASLILKLKKSSEINNTLEYNFVLENNYKLITNKKFQRILKKDKGLFNLRNKYPDFFGMIEFSNIVFEENYAAVYCGLYISSLNAVGSIIILKKNNGKWEIISSPEFWVS